MPPPAITVTKGLKQHKCSDCGIALHDGEVAGSFVGGYMIDYLKCSQEYLDDKHGIEFCSECWDRLNGYRREDQGQAIMRRLQLEREEDARQPPAEKKDILPDPAQTFTDDHPFGPEAPDGTGIGM